MYKNPETFTITTRYYPVMNTGNKYRINIKPKTVTVLGGYWSDGATGGIDACKMCFSGHDWLCGNYFGEGPKPVGGRFDDGTKCTNWQASTIYCDLLREHARKQKGFRKVTLYAMAIYRWPATWLFGGGEARKNGMW